MRADEKFVEAIPELTDEEIEHYLRIEYRGLNSPYNVIETLDQKLDLMRRWRNRGYDGIAFNEEHFSQKGTTYIPFNDNQIKIMGMEKTGGYNSITGEFK
jgi:hypothetical protein